MTEYEKLLAGKYMTAEIKTAGQSSQKLKILQFNLIILILMMQKIIVKSCRNFLAVLVKMQIF